MATFTGMLAQMGFQRPSDCYHDPMKKKVSITPGRGKRSQLERLITGSVSSDEFRALAPRLHQALTKGDSAASLAYHSTWHRLTRQLTQKEAAAQIRGLSHTTLQRIESGAGTRVALESLVAVADFYETRAEALLAPVDLAQVEALALKHPAKPAADVSLKPQCSIPRSRRG